MTGPRGSRVTLASVLIEPEWTVAQAAPDLPQVVLEHY